MVARERCRCRRSRSGVRILWPFVRAAGPWFRADGPGRQDERRDLNPHLAMPLGIVRFSVGRDSLPVLGLCASYRPAPFCIEAVSSIVRPVTAALTRRKGSHLNHWRMSMGPAAEKSRLIAQCERTGSGRRLGSLDYLIVALLGATPRKSPDGVGRLSPCHGASQPRRHGAGDLSPPSSRRAPCARCDPLLEYETRKDRTVPRKADKFWSLQERRAQRMPVFGAAVAFRHRSVGGASLSFGRAVIRRVSAHRRRCRQSALGT